MTIVDFFRDITNSVSSRVVPTLQLADESIVKVNYEHGHYPEINETLMQKEEAGFRYDKYPMVALLEDVHEEDVGGGVMKAKIRLLICHSSEYDDKSSDRHKKVINPILKPIYDALVEEVNFSKYSIGYGIKPKVVIRPYWGVRGRDDVPEKNIFDDIVDVIEVRFDFTYYDNCK